MYALLHSVFIYFSGGVMIYFDRIEVVNYLVPSAGKVISQCIKHWSNFDKVLKFCLSTQN